MKTLTLRIGIWLLGMSGILLACTSQSAKNKDIPYASIIEVIEINDTILSGELMAVCARCDIPVTSVYRWKNHLIVYDVMSDSEIEGIRKQLSAVSPNSIIKIYETPFYVFDRNCCESKTEAVKWKHTIMTANLVQDSVMQQEYMDYHATQFEKWPEVVYGFCKADFQQLLVFRNGRQLMLVISIPEGKSLDELDPKTTENNPRVNEWNTIMANYQEGIEGSSPDEKWVLFNPVMNNKE